MMPDSPRPPAAPSTVLLMPGASLMDIRPLATGGMRVRCPGCGATMVMTARSAAAVSQVTFVHEDDACPVLAQIKVALARLDAAPTARKH
ncbi:MAG: hypothetical protein ABL971_09555 [Vicinamibacterales bacterium]